MFPALAFSFASFMRRMEGGVFLRFGMLLLLLGAWALPQALACRMVTLIQTTPNADRVQQYWVEQSRSLMHQSHASEPYYQTAGQSLNTNMVEGVVPTVDGVGIAGFDADAQFLNTLYYRQSQPLDQASVAFKDAVSRLGKTGTVLMGHVRARTTGPVAPFNNHPFVVTLNTQRGGTWAFMANGGTQISAEDYTRLVKDVRLVKACVSSGCSSPTTLTDSEKLFHVLLSPLLPFLDATALKGDGFNTEQLEYFAHRLSQTYGAIQGKIPPKVMRPFVKGGGYSDAAQGHVLDEKSHFLRYTPKTWVMSNGAYTFIFVHGYEQWYQVHYGGEDRSYASALVFASEPTNIKEFYANGEAFLNDADSGHVQGASISRWQQLPQDSLSVVYDSGQGLRMRLFPVVMPQTAYPKVPVYAPKKGQGKGAGIAVPPEFQSHPLGCRC